MGYAGRDLIIYKMLATALPSCSCGVILINQHSLLLLSNYLQTPFFKSMVPKVNRMDIFYQTFVQYIK